MLCNRRASIGLLVLSLLRALLEAAIVSVLLLLILGVTLSLAFDALLPAWGVISIIVLTTLFILIRHVMVWLEATFRVTTERILLENPLAFFHAPLTTVKWSQYQECEVSHREFLDVLFGARPLHIRYGTADARHEAKFPSLRYAHDLKHFLDKVDAAVRNGTAKDLKPFVAKRRGKRD